PPSRRMPERIGQQTCQRDLAEANTAVAKEMATGEVGRKIRTKRHHSAHLISVSRKDAKSQRANSRGSHVAAQQGRIHSSNASASDSQQRRSRSYWSQ